MTPIKISASALDQLTWYRRIESMDTSELVARFRGKSETKPDMFAGTALHTLLENHNGGMIEGEVIADTKDKDGNRHEFRFEFSLNATLELPQAREVWGSRILDVFGQPVELRCFADGITGGRVDEYKLTKNATEESFANSNQWRAYLYVFGAHSIRYSAFKKLMRGNLVEINEMNQFTFYPYPHMQHDLQIACVEYIEFCREHCPDVLER